MIIAAFPFKTLKTTAMKTRSILLLPGLLIAGLAYSCIERPKTVAEETSAADTTKTQVVLIDYGAHPTVLNIDDYTMANEDFRMALWTGTYFQVTLMSIPVGGEVGLEQHNTTDQFLRVESGKAKVLMGNSEDALTFTKDAGEDFAIIIPAGKWHNIVNTGDGPLKLYSIYSPSEHPFGTVHKTFAEAEAAEHH